jgi:hypothetical protein
MQRYYALVRGFFQDDDDTTLEKTPEESGENRSVRGDGHAFTRNQPVP